MLRQAGPVLHPVVGHGVSARRGVNKPQITGPGLAGPGFYDATGACSKQNPPVTTAAVSGATVNGWQTGPAPKLSFTASDDGLGAGSTVYSIDGGPSQTYSAPVALADGIHTIVFHSTDSPGQPGGRPDADRQGRHHRPGHDRDGRPGAGQRPGPERHDDHAVGHGRAQQRGLDRVPDRRQRVPPVHRAVPGHRRRPARRAVPLDRLARQRRGDEDAERDRRPGGQQLADAARCRRRCRWRWATRRRSTPFKAGVGADYLASTTATVLSTAGDAALSVSDPSSTATGRLVNGTFALASPLQAPPRKGRGVRAAEHDGGKPADDPHLQRARSAMTW